MIYVGLHNS